MAQSGSNVRNDRLVTIEPVLSLGSGLRSLLLLLESLPILPVETLRSFGGLMLTWCASQEPKQLFSLLLVAIPSQPLPIASFAPAPFSGVKLPI